MANRSVDISVEEAQRIILSSTVELPGELAPLFEAAGRVASAEVRAARDLPPWDNSAMDGYAVRAADLAAATDATPVRLRISGVAAAGQAMTAGLDPGTCLRILTGAIIPSGADAVVMQEHVEANSSAATFLASVVAGQNIRRRGEDISHGGLVLTSGQIVRAGEVAMLAAQGRTMVPVHRRPTVTILSTGEELVAPDEPLRPGKIVNSSAYGIAAMVASAGAGFRLVPPIGDDAAKIQAALNAEIAASDVVVTTGGVSVGDFDFVNAALATMQGQMHSWKVAMRPGKPLAFGAAQGRLVFGLPGNPVAALIAFELFVRPALLRMAGHVIVARPMIEAALAQEHRKSPAVRHYLRGIVRSGTTGYHLTLVPKQRAASLSSTLGVNAIAVFEAGQETFRAGHPVRCVLLAEAI